MPYLSLTVDTILSSRLAKEAGEAAKVPVYPVLPYGLAQQWVAFPGTVTFRVQTYLAVIRDVMDSIRRAGFRRILLVNGHGGNAPALGMIKEWMMDNPDTQVKMAQLVQRSQDLGKSAADRSHRFSRFLDGKLSLDAPGWHRPS